MKILHQRAIVWLAFFVHLTTPFSIPSLPFIGSRRGGTTSHSRQQQEQQVPTKTSTALFDGTGRTNTYAWKENSMEIEVFFNVPPKIRSKDVDFIVRPRSVGLKLKPCKANNYTESVLLDVNRTMTGQVSMEGTYWTFAQATVQDDHDSLTSLAQTYPKLFDPDNRTLILVLEKNIRAPKNDFDIVNYDWQGLYPDLKDGEILDRNYEKEDFDMEEYCRKMGVDLENINMSHVDKSLFAGLNVSQNAFESLQKAGYVREVTRQDDGTESIVDEDGNAVPFDPYAPNNQKKKIKITSKETSTEDSDTTSIQNKATETPTSPSKEYSDLMKKVRGKGRKVTSDLEELEAMSKSPIFYTEDAIGKMKLQSLKEILREQGLKTSGRKLELQERLKDYISQQKKASAQSQGQGEA